MSGILSRLESTAKSGMVVANHPLGAKAGVEVLRRGGNAADAAVATAFALGVVEPFMCGLGGSGNCVVFMNDDGRGLTINFQGRVPSKARPDMFEIEGERVVYCSAVPAVYHAIKDDANRVGHKAVLVPGVVAGSSLLLEKFGTMSLEDVMQPAIKYAKYGATVSDYVSLWIGKQMKMISGFSETAKIFLRNGFPPDPYRGSASYERGPFKLVQADLAKTLRKIAHGGADAFYRGEIAEAIARDMQENGGLITEEDLARYKPKLLQPRPATYEGYTILHAPGSGGTTMVEILNIIEGSSFRKLGHNTMKYIHLLSEATKLAYIDTSRFACGDPDKMPLDMLESKERAKDLRRQIDSEKTSLEWRIDPNIFHESNTSHFSVVDKDRNVVAWTFSLGEEFGSKVTVPGTGIVMNNHMGAFNPLPGTPNSIEPGRQRFACNNPFIVLKNGNPFLSIGSPGLAVCPTTQVFLNVVNFGMGIQESIEAPRIGVVWPPYGEIVVDSRIPKGVVNDLRALGHEIDSVEAGWRDERSFASPNGILVDPKTGELHGGAHILAFSAFVGRALGY